MAVFSGVLWCRESMRVLAIDPSTKALGWAVFSGGFENSGWIRVRGGKDWTARCDRMIDEVAALAREHRVCMVVIECPDYIRHGGVVADVMKLQGFVFALRERLRHDYQVELLPVHRWKGQVPKTVTIQRIRRRYGWMGNDHNEADAIGIGDWWWRKRKQGSRRED